MHFFESLSYTRRTELRVSVKTTLDHIHLGIVKVYLANVKQIRSLKFLSCFM